MPSEHALVVVRIDLLGRTGLVRSLPMVMSADVLRTVFAAGQTLALLSDRVAVVLAPRNDLLFRQAALLHDLIVERTVRRLGRGRPARGVGRDAARHTWVGEDAGPRPRQVAA